MVDLYNSATYLEAPPHGEFERLRCESPVVWQAIPNEPGYWAVLRHADVVHVAKHPELFSAREGGVVLEDLSPERLDAMRDMLLAMDPPRHTAYRKPISPEFRARTIAGLEGRIRTITNEIFDRSIGDGADVEFVHDVCAQLPSQVIGELMGLPIEDWPKIHAMAERNSGSQDPDIGGGDDSDNHSIEMAMYAIRFAAQRRSEPDREDLTTLLLGTEFDGKFMTDIDFGRFFVQLVTAGNDTTRTMLSSGVDALLQYPDQLEALRENPSLMSGAVEEILRWANPLHYFRRTAMSDVELGGAQISAGDKVAMIYTSANRDEAVFTDPHRFDIHRNPNPHLSFGIGTHFCLGVHLARLEGRVFLGELLRRYSSIESRGPVIRQQSNLNNSLKHQPLRFAA